MTLSHAYKNVNKIMDLLQDIDFMTIDKHIRVKNQKELNEAYNILEAFKDELIREFIKNKQKVGK